jgi:2-polyprenyl-6-hydroxyphenyl methylase/3-demethylubiquinone-9 3-methyltransferase
MNIWRELSVLYRDVPLKHRLHLFLRWKLCPFEEIIKFIPEKGKVIDLGCGHGLFSNLMALTSKERYILGVDIDADKIEIAKKTLGAHRKRVNFHYGDIRNMDFPDCQTITIVDVLYLIPFDLQEELLKICFERLNSRGRLLIKEIDTTPRWKYWIVYIEEFLAVKIFKTTKGNNCYFRSREEFISLLEKIGFDIVETVSLNKGIAPHILYVCDKRGET